MWGGDKRKKGVMGDWGKEGSSAGGPGGKGSDSIPGLGRGQTGPRANLAKEGRAEGERCARGRPCRASSSQGATDHQKEHWAQAAALSACLTLQLCSCSHLPRILRALPGDQLHTLPTRATGKRACAVVSPSANMPDPGGWAPSGAAPQAKARFSGSKALGSI